MSDTYGAMTPPPDTAPSVEPGEQKDIAGQWREFLGNPSNRAAMIQFGLQLTQPLDLGQNTMGAIGQALGGAGEAAGRMRELERKDTETDIREQEAQSRDAARAASADAAAQRNEIAGLRANIAQQNLMSQDALRRSQIEANLMRAQFLAQRVKDLELLAGLGDQQAKVELTEARAQAARAAAILSQERAGVVQQDAGTRRMRAETGDRNVDSLTETRQRREDTRRTDVDSRVTTRERQVEIGQQRENTRRDLGQQRVETGRERVQVQREGQGLTSNARARRDYETYRNNVEKANAENRLIWGPSSPDIKPPLSFREWEEQNRPTGPGAAPAPAAAKPLRYDAQGNRIP